MNTSNSYKLKIKKSNRHIYIYIFYKKKILTQCSTNNKKIKLISENGCKNSFNKIKKLTNILIKILISRNIKKILFVKKYQFKSKIKLIHNILKKKKLLLN